MRGQRHASANLWPGKESPVYPSHRRLNGPHIYSGLFGEEKPLLLLPGIEQLFQVVQHEARSLYQLCYHGTLIDIITFLFIKQFMPLSISRSNTMHIFIESSYIPTCLGSGHNQGRHFKFNVHGSVHRESMSIVVQQGATMYSLLYFCKLLYMFG